MRRLAICLAMTAVLAACASQPRPAPASTSSSATGAGETVNPANVKRIRPALPPGYEVADMTGPVSAAGLWGFGPGWTAQPPQCAALADPAPGDAGARGLSASGAGGTVYVVVAPAVAPSDAALVDQCGQWTMNFAHTSGAVTLAEAPRIEGADTIAMTVATRTAVESGTETVGQATTDLAYLGGHVAFVTLVTDPGSVHPPLESQIVAELLVKTVTALRG